MSANSNIEWTEHTWNPTLGCSKKSPGCKGCYAIRTVHRLAGNPNPKVRAANAGLTVIQNGAPNWTGVVRLIPERLQVPLLRKKPTTYFVNSLSDLFHESLPDEAIDQVFAVMALCPQHTFQVLTKTADRMQAYFAAFVAKNADHAQRLIGRGERCADWMLRTGFSERQVETVADAKFWRGLPNVWLGVSAENQEWADKRIPLLLRTPAAIRFVSAEPLLGQIDFTKFFDHGLECNYCLQWRGTEDSAIPDGNVEDPGFLCPRCGEACAHIPLDERLDLLIDGGESGPGARPTPPEWFRSNRDQCAAAGVAYFHKQNGEWDTTPRGRKNAKSADVPVGDGTHHRMFRVGKKLAGRLLDDRTWNEFPGAASVRSIAQDRLSNEGAEGVQV